MNAGQGKDSRYIDNLVAHSDGVRFFKNVTGSPGYWAARKKNLNAMIKQRGKPVLFLTVTTSENTNPELLQCLDKLCNKRNLSKKEAYELDKSEKTKLIQNDPITCARKFHHNTGKLMNMLRKEGGIFDEYYVVDSYERTEYQSRGSPHKHILLWLSNNPPEYDPDSPDSIQRCVEFIDRFITCRYDPNNPLMIYQHYKHTHTCYKNSNSKKRCRFNYPLPCMPRTCILTPLPKEETTNSILENCKRINELMVEFGKKSQNMPFDEILKKLNLSENDYIMAIRSSLIRDQVFLRRSSMEVDVNAYNPDILACIESNMDLHS